MSKQDNAIAAIIEIAGPGGTISDPRELTPYVTEWRGLYTGKTPLLVKPQTVEQVSAMVAICHEAQIPIVPQGGNTGLVGGGVPDETGDEIIINLSRMNRIRHRDPLNHTITVEAGCILANIQKAADEMDRLFPLSLAAEGSCEIGGNISTNAGGIAVLKYGNMRDLVLGLEVVLPDGRIWNGLRTLRKDNTGYDLKHLFIGAEGTLGIITAASLKLFPKVKDRATAIVALPSPAAAVDLLSLIRASSGDMVSAFELMPRIGLDFVLRHIANTREPLAAPYPWYGLVELTSARTGAGLGDVLESILVDAMQQGLVLDGAIASSQAQAADFWRLREAMSEAQKPEGGSIKHDISVPVSRVAAFIETASKAVETFLPGIRPVPFGHIGDGNIHFNLSQPVGTDKAAYLSHWGEVNRIVHDIVVSLGGSISAEHGIGRLKVHELAHYKNPLELEMMRAVKRSFDPENIMNPGRVLAPSFREAYFTAPDGVAIHYRDYDTAASGPTPVLCLHGLTRNARDFEDLAPRLAANRRVIAADMRGRGKSGYDPNYMNYQIPSYVADVLGLLAAANLSKVIVIGTSMGGIIAMMMAALRPDLLAGVVLNDVGPEIDPRGLARIAGYAGKLPPVTTWQDAADQAREINGAAFPDYGPAEWMRFARRIFKQGESGAPQLDYDPGIGVAMRESAKAAAPGDLWALFAALKQVPTLAIRGETSDILSQATFDKMAGVHPAMTRAIISGRGHAPALDEAESLAAIRSFLRLLP